MNKPSRRQRTFQLLRLLLAACILGWLLYRLPVHTLQEVLIEGFRQWPWWLAGLAATFLGLLAGCARWHLILRTQQFHLPMRTVFRLFFIGQFFNSFLPGGCGGDVARAWYAARLCNREKTRAASTVLVDRGIGLLTTLFFGVFMILLHLRLFLQHTLLTACGGMMLAGAFCAALLLILALRRNLFSVYPFFQRVEKSRFGPMLRKVYEVAYYYRAHPAVLLVCLICSMLNLILLTLACHCFARSLMIALPIGSYFMLFPIITVLTAIPITPGALGVREGLFAELFKTLGAATYRTIPLSLLVYFGGLFWSLFGGLLYVIQPVRERMPVREEEEK